MFIATFFNVNEKFFIYFFCSVVFLLLLLFKHEPYFSQSLHHNWTVCPKFCLSWHLTKLESIDCLFSFLGKLGVKIENAFCEKSN